MVLVNTGKADDHLTRIEQETEQHMDALLPQLIKTADVAEELKAHDQIAWIVLMSNCKAIEEIIFLEHICN